MACRTGLVVSVPASGQIHAVLQAGSHIVLQDGSVDQCIDKKINSAIYSIIQYSSNGGFHRILKDSPAALWFSAHDLPNMIARW
jgi:hypothetical protein